MTYLEQRVSLADYNRLWTEAITQPDGTYSARQTDDETEREFWKNFMKKKNGYRQDETAAPVMNAVKKILDGYDVDSILEIGPGWGNYTIELSRLCRSLTCVDISPDVLSYIGRIAKENGRPNITGLLSKWEDVKPERKYDVVFGYNCFYRIKDLEQCFRQMDLSARKLCMAGMGMGMMPPYYSEMKEKLGCRLLYGRKDMIYFINILYSMGIDADMKIIPLKKKFIYGSWDEALRGETSRLDAPQEWIAEKRPEIQEILSRYFRMREDGKLEYEYVFRGAVVSWEPCCQE